MNLDIVKSIDGVPIRLTDERWYEHILVEHPEMSGHYESVLSTVESPMFVLRGIKPLRLPSSTSAEENGFTFYIVN